MKYAASMISLNIMQKNGVNEVNLAVVVICMF